MGSAGFMVIDAYLYPCTHDTLDRTGSAVRSYCFRRNLPVTGPQPVSPKSFLPEIHEFVLTSLDVFAMSAALKRSRSTWSAPGSQTFSLRSWLTKINSRVWKG